MEAVTRQVGQVILGKEEVIREIMLAFLAGGHVLLEDIPGVGKTPLALAFSRAMRLEYRRVQFTPDVLPSDLTGFSIYRREEERFVYQEGSVFCNLLLADEINRTSPKTQSALPGSHGGAKSHRGGRDKSGSAAVSGHRHPESAGKRRNAASSGGTGGPVHGQPFRGYPDYESELAMVLGVRKQSRVEEITPVFDAGTLQKMQSEVNAVYLKENVADYIVRLVRATQRERPTWSWAAVRERPSLSHGWQRRPPGLPAKSTSRPPMYQDSFLISSGTGWFRAAQPR